MKDVGIPCLVTGCIMLLMGLVCMWRSKPSVEKTRLDESCDNLSDKIHELIEERDLLLLVREPLKADQMTAAFANAGESALYKAVIQTIEQEREIVAHRARTAGNPDERAVEVGGERALNLLREVLVRKVVEATRKAAS